MCDNVLDDDMVVWVLCHAACYLYSSWNACMLLKISWLVRGSSKSFMPPFLLISIVMQFFQAQDTLWICKDFLYILEVFQIWSCQHLWLESQVIVPFLFYPYSFLSEFARFRSQLRQEQYIKFNEWFSSPPSYSILGYHGLCLIRCRIFRNSNYSFTIFVTQSFAYFWANNWRLLFRLSIKALPVHFLDILLWKYVFLSANELISSAFAPSAKTAHWSLRDISDLCFGIKSLNIP